ncbi:hypothetical protein GCM10010102_34460 [Promicromonospora citrea]|uniref:Uncharacterized protein n=2 Tax=Promicromonospora citrea TaxID=43677 RepID=A0A8H9L5A0_9MICO|nr:hypothetical protein GCM10010102_34460 [Promicromonospora citrea]
MPLGHAPAPPPVASSRPVAREWWQRLLREAAINEMDETLLRLQKAGDEVMGGDGVVELTTNSTKAAEFIEARMKQLGIRGYVRIVPE